MTLSSSASLGEPWTCKVSNTSGLDTDLFFLGQVAGACSSTLLPELRPHIQKAEVWQKLWGKKFFLVPKISHIFYSRGLADLQLHEHRFGRIRVKLSSNHTQSLELILQL